MRNGSTSEHSVQERGLWCTELTFGAKNSLLVYATRFQRHSVQKTGFCTEVIFCTGNPLLRYRRNIRCAEQPPGVPNEAEECGSGSGIGDFAKTAIVCASSCHKLPQTTAKLDYHKLRRTHQRPGAVG